MSSEGEASSNMSSASFTTVLTTATALSQTSEHLQDSNIAHSVTQVVADDDDDEEEDEQLRKESELLRQQLTDLRLLRKARKHLKAHKSAQNIAAYELLKAETRGRRSQTCVQLKHDVLEQTKVITKRSQEEVHNLQRKRDRSIMEQNAKAWRFEFRGMTYTKESLTTKLEESRDRELMLRPLADIGIAIRHRKFELCKSLRVQRDSIIVAGNAAAHWGNALADVCFFKYPKYCGNKDPLPEDFNKMHTTNFSATYFFAPWHVYYYRHHDAFVKLVDKYGTAQSFTSLSRLPYNKAAREFLNSFEDFKRLLKESGFDNWSRENQWAKIDRVMNLESSKEALVLMDVQYAEAGAFNLKCEKVLRAARRARDNDDYSR